MASIAQSTVLQDACLATLGGQSTTTAQSVFVSIYALPRDCNNGAVTSPIFLLAGNSCTCENGVAQTGVHCPTNGVAKCASCNPGWTINHEKTKCIRTYPCSCVELQQQRSAPLICLCAVNTCTCKNGLAQTGEHCPANGAAKCASCNAGFHMNEAKTECARKSQPYE